MTRIWRWSNIIVRLMNHGLPKQYKGNVTEPVDLDANVVTTTSLSMVKIDGSQEVQSSVDN